MKKLFAVLILLSIICTSQISFANPIGFSGGVRNEYEYEEIVFVTGEPIKFIGECKITEKEKDNVKTVTYKFDLVSADKTLEGSLDRSITLVTTYNNKNDKGQSIGQTELTKYSEDIEILEDEFELEDFQLSQSDVIDGRPASDFYSGNIKGRKYYTINDDEGEVIVEITGGDVGYQNFWGNTETQILDITISSIRSPEEDDSTEYSWDGTVRTYVSDSLTKSLRYSDNQANLSSFNGGYIKTTDSEMVSKYEYNLPRMKGIDADAKKRNSGTISISKNMVPRVERLIIPKFKDLGGHWAESYIEKLYSLEVLDEVSEFFTPDIPMTRVEFTEAVMKACNIRPSLEEESTSRKRSKDKEPEVSPFIDVPIDNENYQYIKEAYEKGIIQGESNRFNPNTALTKAQAITILMRALGLEIKAPTPGYYLPFSDNSDIPMWAKDSIYVAKEIGIIQGDESNKVLPNKKMTRAEASAMLVRFLEFLEKDLQRDYRENVILFN